MKTVKKTSFSYGYSVFCRAVLALRRLCVWFCLTTFFLTSQAFAAGSGTSGDPFTTLSDAYSVGSSGRYYFNLGSGTFQADVDTSEGGGWVLVLQYVHQGGTNPALSVIGAGSDLPVLSAAALGTDESGDATKWGHAGNAAMAQTTGDIELRWYGETSHHSRIIHFKSTIGDDYVRTGVGSFAGLKSTHTTLIGHTANLPVDLNTLYSDKTDYAMTNFPFYTVGTYHWGVRGHGNGAGDNGNRWEVDDATVTDTQDTIHRVWVRTTPGSLEVTNTNNSGVGSLRQAILDANASTTDDYITFNISGGGPHKISLSSVLPDIDDDGITIDGTTQSGASCGDLWAGTPHTLMIQVDGVDQSFNGLVVDSDGVLVKGLSLTNFNIAVNARGSSSNFTALCNYMGVAPDGTAAGNASRAIVASSSGATIGGLSAGQGNVLSNSVIGIVAANNASDIAIRGNFIGTDPTGMSAQGNNSRGITFGSTSVTMRDITKNLISGGHNPILFNGSDDVSASDGTFEIAGNYIGVNRTGTAALANTNDDAAVDVGSSNTTNIVIGGTTAADRNVISGNENSGIRVNGNANGVSILGNYIGTDAAGTAAIPNTTVGVDLSGSDNVTIGNGMAAGRNVISGNTTGGISATGVDNLQIQDNYIGVSADGASGLGNGTTLNEHGIKIASGTNMTIDSNVVSDNKGVGILFIGGTSHTNTISNNIVGLDASGTNGLGNSQAGIQLGNGSGTLSGFTISDNIVSGGLSNGMLLIQNSGSLSDVDVLGNIVGLNSAGTADIANNGAGIKVQAATNVDIGDGTAAGRNVISGNTGDGVHSTDSESVSIRGNYIGTSVDGMAALGNGVRGIYTSGSQNVTIGDGTAGGGNVISGNVDHGLQVHSSTNHTYQNNYIGLAADGLAALGNGGGGLVVSSPSSSSGIVNLVIDGNYIGSNTQSGINITSSSYVEVGAASSITITGNRIGLAADDTTARGNGSGIGSTNVPGVTIGGTGVGDGNLIANNSGDGIAVSSLTPDTVILGNRIWNSGNLGIDLGGNGGDGLTANDAGDGDSGANDLLNFPVINTITASGSTSVMYNVNLDVPANTEGYRIEFYKNSSADSSGHGEGETFLGFVDTGNHPGGSVNFDGTFTATEAVSSGDIISTTATRKTGATSYDITSEFSANYTVVSALIVTNTNDSGAGSLRQAITNANASPTMDNITFAIPGAGPHVINLTSALPQITDEGVSVDGSTQSGTVCNNLWDGNGHILQINLDGTSAGIDSNAFDITASNVTLKGMSITNFQYRTAYTHSGALAPTFDCLYAGVKPDGTTQGANVQNSGIQGAFYITDTGATFTRNLISGNNTDANDTGIIFGAGGATVQGNFIGTVADGSTDLANGQDGILIAGSGTSIGGTGSGQGNLISGNTSNGLRFTGSAANVSILGNFVGLNRAGTAALPNGENGLHVQPGGSSLFIGDGTVAGRNVISGNGDKGISLAGVSNANVLGNYIGTSADGASEIANGDDAIAASTSANDVTVGGLSAGEGNVIVSSTAKGILFANIQSSEILGNFVGLNAAGTSALGGGVTGIEVSSGGSDTIVDGNVVGAFSTAVRIGKHQNLTFQNNLLGETGLGADVGGTGVGISITPGGDAESTNWQFINNTIANYGAHGVSIGPFVDSWLRDTHFLGNTVKSNDGSGFFAENDAVLSIGDGTVAGANTITGNMLHGINNFTSDTVIAILGNIITSNGKLGINLQGGTQDVNNVTANDADDSDDGPNELLNYPVINTITASGSTSVMYNVNLDVPANTEGYRIEFYKNSAGDASGHGEGETFLGFVDTGNHPGGSVNFDGTFTATEAVSSGDIISATATRKTGATSYDITSEFSANYTVVSALIVMNTNDSGAGSLRQAIENANADPSMDDITFAIPGAGPHVINLTSQLPVVSDDGVTIDGTSQSGTTCGDLWAGTPPTLKIHLNGSSQNFNGLVSTAEGVTFKGLSITDFNFGVVAQTASTNTALECSYVGLEPDGTPIGNVIGVGVLGAITVGGLSAGEGNVISANDYAVLSYNGSTYFALRGNFVGTDPTGMSLQNNSVFGVSHSSGTGVWDDITNNLIAGTHPLSFQSDDDVSAANTRIVVKGNYIGTDRTGNSVLGADGGGAINIGSGGLLSPLTIGGTTVADRNVIASTNGVGIGVIDLTDVDILGNHIGIGADGSTALGVATFGIYALGMTDLSIGDGTSDGRNIVGQTTNHAVWLQNGNGAEILGNYIGVASDGVTARPSGQSGIALSNEANATIGNGTAGGRNIVSGNTDHGIVFTGTGNSGHLVDHNYIGVGADGSTAVGNGVAGVYLVQSVASATVTDNTISSNQFGVVLQPDTTMGTLTFTENKIGTDATGLLDRGNTIDGFHGNMGTGSVAALNIGLPGQGNVIAGNTRYGIYLNGYDTGSILGNTIGLGSDGSTEIPNDDHTIWLLHDSNILVGDGTAAGRNVISSGGKSGITISGTSDTVSILGNYIGTDSTGTLERGHTNHGIAVLVGDNITIGDGTAGGRNVISGNTASGIYSGVTTNLSINGNYLGTNASGTGAVGNGTYGVILSSTSGSGGITNAQILDNVISGNSTGGIDITSGDENNLGDTVTATIQGNFIGVAANGTSPLGNANFGIKNTNIPGTILVGGANGGNGNIIAHHGFTGILIQDEIGAKLAIVGNNIHSNTGLGIDVTGGVEDGNGVTANDGGDGDSGPNDLLNFPVINTITASGTTSVTYNVNLDVPANTEGYRIEFYKNSSADASGHGEGETFLGFVDTGNHAGGSVNFDGTFTATEAVSSGDIISTTATRKTGATSYDITSEFSANYTVVSALVVTNTNDSGAGSLRQAIENANADPSMDDITFNIPGAGPHVIAVSSQLPSLTDAGISIDGSTQSGATCGTSVDGNNVLTDRNLLIQIEDNNLTGNVDGLRITGNNITVKGLSIGGFPRHGLFFNANADNAVITCNHIGVDAAGTAQLSNLQNGIYGGAASDVQIGDGTPQGRNIIGNNYYSAISINTIDAILNDNYIGVDLTGTGVAGNGVGPQGFNTDGLYIRSDASGTQILNNIISGNARFGIDLFVQLGTTTIQGNKIGTDVSGLNAIPNGTVGIWTNGGGTIIIGGTGAGEENLVAGNGEQGLRIGGTSTATIILGNLIGVDATGNTALANGHYGIEVTDSASNVTIGNGTASGRNIISGNTLDGIRVLDGSDTITINGNYIGLAADGDTALGNGGIGIHVSQHASGPNPENLTITNNVVSSNSAEGVQIVTGETLTFNDNIVGLNAAGTTARGNGRQGVNLGDTGNGLSGSAVNPVITVTSFDGNVISGNAFAGLATAFSVGTLGGTGGSDLNITNNIFGLSADKTLAFGNLVGIEIASGGFSSDVVIGGTGINDRNWISANSIQGISVRFNDQPMHILGNRIGITEPGQPANFANGKRGIRLKDTTSAPVYIGDGTNAGRNVISGNGDGVTPGLGAGIHITGDASGDVINNNLIGVMADGTTPSPNLTHGIHVNNSTTTGLVIKANILSQNTESGILVNDSTGSIIGDGTASGANIITNNTLAGVSVTGTGEASILNNIIHSNGGLGIDLDTGAAGVTANDSGDGDTGPNDLLNFPVINTITASGSTSVMYNVNLDVPANTEGYRIEFYKNSSGDASGHGEGETFLGFVDTGNHAGGSVNFDGTFTATETVSSGDIISTTATRKTGATSYDITSEFSANYTVVSALIVTNTNDSGAGSLRQAIENANADPSMDDITFNIPGAGPHVISLLSELPTITDPGVVIDGSSQSGAVCNNLWDGNGHTIKIRIDGTGAGLTDNAFAVSADNVTIKGFSITNFQYRAVIVNSSGTNAHLDCLYAGVEPDGVTKGPNVTGNIVSSLYVLGSGSTVTRNVVSGNDDDTTDQGIDIANDNITVTGNFVGTTADGAAALGNGGRGIFVNNAGDNAMIGGTGAGEGNLISGNGENGIEVLADNGPVSILGNIIGLNRTGSAAIANGMAGIYVLEAPAVSIGNGTSAGRNIISGNTTEGIFIELSDGTEVLGNYLGTNIDGTTAIKNLTRGLAVTDGTNINIGDGTAGARNVISGNNIGGVRGIRVDNLQFLGNYVGVTADGTSALGNGSTVAHHGLHLSDTTNSLLDGNVISESGGAGILFFNGTSNGIVISNNLVGLDASGATDLGNTLAGIQIGNGTGTLSDFDIIDNVVSGNNTNGIALIPSSGTLDGVDVLGNIIGLNASGTGAVGNNASGLRIRGATNVRVGDGTVSGRNVISGGLGAGITLNDVTTGISVLGNYIGTGTNPSTNLGNDNHGIFIDNATGVTIGDTSSGGSNLIAHNGGRGVTIATDTSEVAILRNSIYDNADLGIDVGNDFKTDNDPGDGDPGPNDLLNFPVINAFMGDGGSGIDYDINLDVPSHTNGYRIDFYKNSSAHASGHGEGETWLGFVETGNHAGGDLNFTGNFTPDVVVVQGDLISATTTRKTATGFDITSEFAFTISTGSATELIGTKSVSVYDPLTQGLYNLPGNDVISSLTVTNPGAAATTADTIVIIEGVPSELEFYNGDIDDGGPETNPVSFSQTGGAGLTFTYGTDVKYSNSGTKPTDMAQCNYTPSAGYDSNVTYVCFNPKGAMQPGDPDPTFTLEYRARIK